MTTDAAGKAVFETAELLENIVLFVLPKSIIASQRTCQQFQNVIASPIKIQEKLFIRPVWRETPLWVVNARRHSKAPNENFTKVEDGATVPESTMIAKPVAAHYFLHAIDFSIPLQVHQNLRYGKL